MYMSTGRYRLRLVSPITDLENFKVFQDRASAIDYGQACLELNWCTNFVVEQERCLNINKKLIGLKIMFLRFLLLLGELGHG